MSKIDAGGWLFKCPLHRKHRVCMGMLCWPIAQSSTVMGMHFRPHTWLRIGTINLYWTSQIVTADAHTARTKVSLSVFVAFLSYPKASNEWNRWENIRIEQTLIERSRELQQVLVIVIPGVNFHYDWNWNHKTWVMPSSILSVKYFLWSKIAQPQ